MAQTGTFASLLQVVTGPLAVAVALLTQLGDLWLLFTVVTLAYWLDVIAPWVGHGLDRERAALVVALLAGVVAVLETLKPLFAVPRPSGFDVAPTAEFLPAALYPVYAWMATASGYSFPSGHALGSTIVWGGLAWSVRVGRLRTRAVVAAVIVVLVAASRVLLGLHYAVDVAVGTAVGLAYLAVAVGLFRDAGRAFVLATAIAVVGIVLTGVRTEAVAAIGLAVGLTATWYWLGEELVAAPATRAGSLATVALGAVAAVPVVAGAVVVDVPLWLVALGSAAGGFLLLALPLAGERIGPALIGRTGRPSDSS